MAIILDMLVNLMGYLITIIQNCISMGYFNCRYYGHIDNAMRILTVI